MSDDLTFVKRLRRPLGRVRRWVKRTWWERLTGREYRRWLRGASDVVPGSHDNSVEIAVLVPVFNPPPAFLRECVDSVVNQQAKRWQLVLIDDGSTDPEVKALLDHLERELRDDGRVAILRLPNGGISAALNAGLEHVRTSHVGWLDHDDLLDPRCITMFSDVLDSHDPDIVYSDEDKVDASGHHFEFYAKPDFSPELLMTQMYLCHFTVFRTELLRQIGGFRSEMDGAQDYDVALRLLPLVSSVHHVPLPLYHWRRWEQSTAQSIEAKPWALEATTRVQREYLDRTFGGGDVVPNAVRGLNDVHPRVGAIPRISVIIPTAGTVESSTGRRHVDVAIESLRDRETTCNLEFVAVTTGELSDSVDADTTVVLHPSDGFNFSEAINAGVQAATGEYLFLLNDDTQAITSDPLLRMTELLQIPGVGIVGCELLYPDGRLQHVGMTLIPSGPTHCWIARAGSTPGYFGSLLTPRNYSAVTAAAMLVRRETFEEIGGFDEIFARDYNDVDFCLRAAARSWRTAWTPYARFLHHEGTSLVRKVPAERETQIFRDRHKEALQCDPFYSPRLGQTIDRLYDVR